MDLSSFRQILLIFIITLAGITTCAAVQERKPQIPKDSAESYSYETAVADTASSIAADADRMTFEYKMAQLQEKRFYVVLLAILSIVSLLVVLFLMKKSSPTAEDIVLVMGLNFVVFGTIISVLVVNTTEQLAAATGILGAMGGYLFGSKHRERTRKDEAPNGMNAL